MEKNFLVKSVDWEYEQEERAIDRIRGHGIHPYDRKRILKSVIAGMRVENPEYERLSSIICKMNQELGIDVKLYRAKPVRGEFALHVPGREDL